MKKIILSDQQLNELVGSVTEKILDGRENLPEEIGGEEILHFAEHPQVNKFVLFQIYNDWSAHMKKLEHPYFDYSQPEVKKALRDFQTILSDYIRVPQADFRKMLEQAVYNTLKLIVNPEDAIGNFFFRENDNIPLEMFRRHAPYFDDFGHVLKALLRFFEKNNIPRVLRREFFEKFDKVVEIYEKKEARPVLDYQKERFLKLTGIELMAYLQRPAPAAKEPRSTHIQVPAESPAPKQNKPATPPPAQKEAQPQEQKPEGKLSDRFEKEETPSINQRFAQKEKQSLVERMKAERQEQKSQTPKVPEQPPVEQKTTVEPPQEVLPKEEPKKEQEATPETPRRRVPSLLGNRKDRKKAEEKPREEPQPQEEPERKVRKSTIDLFAERKRKEAELREKKRTLADKLGNKESKTLNEQAGVTKAIRTDQIPVHKQFQFVQKVFGGSSVKFKVVLDKINKTETIEEAKSVLNRYVFNDPTVNRSDKVCKEFEALVRGRFEN